MSYQDLEELDSIPDEPYITNKDVFMKFKSLNVKIRVFRGCYAARIVQSAADGERSGPDILKGSSINSSVLMGVAQNMVRSILAEKTETVNFL